MCLLFFVIGILKKMRDPEGLFGKGDGSMWIHNDSKNPLSSSMVLYISEKVFFSALLVIIKM